MSIVVGIIAGMAALALIGIVVHAGCMSDEDRKQLGLGPKGQGR